MSICGISQYSWEPLNDNLRDFSARNEPDLAENYPFQPESSISAAIIANFVKKISEVFNAFQIIEMSVKTDRGYWHFWISFGCLATFSGPFLTNF